MGGYDINSPIMQKEIQKLSACRIDDGKATQSEEELIVELPLQVSLNDEAYTVTMRTPGADHQLVLGLLYSEGLPVRASTLVDVSSHCLGSVAEVSLEEEFERAERRLMSVSSCGLCGRSSIEDLFDMEKSVLRRVKVSVLEITRLFEEMRMKQKSFAKTGACHGAAAATVSGEILSLHEDVGRHNAVDKVIGDLLLQEKLDKADIMLVSGRVSWEIMQKTVRAGIPVLAAVSAPTALSAQFAGEWGLTLAAFCRDGRMTVYSGTERVTEIENVIQ